MKPYVASRKFQNKLFFHSIYLNQVIESEQSRKAIFWDLEFKTWI